MIINRKWQTLLSALPPTHTPEEVEQARRLFFAGATAAFEALIKETDGQATETQVSIIKAVESELIQHRNTLAEIRRRKVN